jgi:predicted aspartyl protease
MLAALTTIGACPLAGERGRFPPQTVLPQEPEGRQRGPRAMQLPFQLSHGVLVVVKGRIGGLGNLRFVLDTGTSQTVVDRRVADQLHLSCWRGGPLLNLARTVRPDQCALSDLEIGSFRVKRLPVSVARLSEFSAFLDEADVLIGLDLLGSSKFTIDYSSDKVVFERLDQPDPKLKTDPDDPLTMTAVIQVQGHPIRLIIDTGIQGVLLYENRLRGKVPHVRVLRSAERVNIGGVLPAKRLILPGVQFGGAETNCAVLLISGPPNNALPGIDGFLGVSVLGARRLTLDFIDKTMSWER